MDRNEAVKELEKASLKLDFPFNTVKIAEYEIENKTFSGTAIIYGNLATSNNSNTTSKHHSCTSYFIRFGDEYWYRETFDEVCSFILALQSL